MKKILNSKELIDKILSGSQRKTPTVVHKRFSIERIRNFYIRKIKFVQQNFNNQINEALDSFPCIDYIHPFFGDLLNLMFQRQHYKLALSKLSRSKRAIEFVSKNFVKFVKNGDSLYTCKQLKKEALGRICTIIQKLNKPFSFLEKVRYHLEKIPNLDPHRKLIILSGSPKVGKSSCLNKITRANVLTGESNQQGNFILLGHMQTNFSRLQILDLGGVSKLNHRNQNSFVMQMYNLSLNLDCVLVNLFDLSESFSIPLSRQIELFKILDQINFRIEKILLFTKTDLCWEKFLNATQKAGLYFLLNISKTSEGVLKISFHDEIGINYMKKEICKIVYKCSSFEDVKNKIKCSRFLDKTGNQVSKMTDTKQLVRTPLDNFLNLKRLSKRPEKLALQNSSNSSFGLEKVAVNGKSDVTKSFLKPSYLLNEREQKNRELKTEKIYIELKLLKFREKDKVREKYRYISRNKKVFDRAVYCSNK